MNVLQDPASAYKSTYRAEFHTAAENFFDAAVDSAGIDIAANARLASVLYRLIRDHESHGSTRNWWFFLLVFLSLGILGWGGGMWYMHSSGTQLSPQHWIGFGSFAVLGAVLLFTLIIPRIRQISAKMDELEAKISAKKAEALAQLAPLYDYFGWKTCQQLISQVMPELQFDDFLTEETMQECCSQFGFGLSEAEDTSILAADSGRFHGYPFVFTRFKKFEWGEKVWTGSLTISWKTRERDADGKYHWVTHYETLVASLTKPYPEFPVASALYAGHSAVPALNFSRTPSELSGKSGFWADLGKKRAFKRLHKFAQNLEDDSNYTMMSNRDFEILFHCTDRNDEVAFRQLFTPLAQEKMVKLLNDRACGYGDDFYYSKIGKYTLLVPYHLAESEIVPLPFRFESFDLAAIKKVFLNLSCEYFRSVYFSFAPLLAIPLYNEPRLAHDIPAAGENISVSEIEAAANYIGEKYFAHPASITQDVLSVKLLHQRNNIVFAEVSALGFKGVERVEYVERLGGDGNWHQVPVRWVEYIPVRRTSTICAARYGDVDGIDLLCYRRGIMYWRP